MQSRFLFAWTFLSILFSEAKCFASDIGTVIADEDLVFEPFETYLPCADGSPAGFYREASLNSNTISESNHVMVFLGGGVCLSEEACNDKVESSEAFLFSSDFLPRSVKGHTLLSRNATENPIASDFTRWIVPYCSQDLFLGSVDPSVDRQLARRGDDIFEAALNTLKVSFDNSTIDTLIVAGISAGSIGIMNHIESVQKVSQDANVTKLRLILDSVAVASNFNDESDLNNALEATIDPERHPLCSSSYTQAFHSQELWNIPCCVSIHCMLENDPVLQHLNQAEDSDGRERLLLLDSLYDPVVFGSTLLMNPAEVDSTARSAKISDIDASFSKILEVAGSRDREFTQSAYGSKSRLGDSVLWAVTNAVTHQFLIAALEIEQLRCGTNDDGAEVYGLDEINGLGLTVCKDDGLGVRADLIHGLTGIWWQTTDSWNLCTVDGEPIRDIIYDFVHNDDIKKHGLLRDQCSGPNCIPSGATEPNPVQKLFVLNDDFVSISLAAKIFLLCAMVCLILTYFLRLLPVTLKGPYREETDADAKSGKAESNSSTRPSQMTNGIIALKNISVKVRDSEKFLLDDLSFSLPPGSITALLGSSGAGKSTLLNLLCGQLPDGLEGFKRDWKFESLGIHTSYLRQFGNSSFQNIELSAYLKLTAKLYGASTSELETAVTFLKKSFADRVGVGPNFGGIRIKELSGGQQRTVAIVTTMLTKPKLLLLDEPLSGLDSVSSQIIMEFLGDIAKEESCAILLTLHQPSDAILEQIDRSLVLHRGKLMFNQKARSSFVIHDLLEDLAKGEKSTTWKSWTYKQACMSFEAEGEGGEEEEINCNESTSVIGNDSEFRGFDSNTSDLDELSEEPTSNSLCCTSLSKMWFDAWQIIPLMRRLHLEHGHDYGKLLELPICFIFFTVLLRFDKGSAVQFLLASTLFVAAPTFIFVPILLQTCESYKNHQLELQDGRISPRAYTFASFFCFMSMPVYSIALGLAIGYGILGWDFGTYIDQFLLACLYFLGSFQLGRVLILVTDGNFAIVEQVYMIYVAFGIVTSGGVVAPNKLPPYIRWLSFLSLAFWAISGISLVHFEQETYLESGDICSSLLSCIIQDGSFMAHAIGYAPISSTRMSYIMLLSIFFALFLLEYVLMVRRYGSKREF